MPVTTIAKTIGPSGKPKSPMIVDDLDPPRLYVLALIALKLNFLDLAILLARFLAEEDGDPTSMQLLEACYQVTEWPQYNESALYWYRLADENGYPKAKRAIASLLMAECKRQPHAPDGVYERFLREWNAKPTKEEKDAAVEWYRDLADSGDSEAACLYGLLLISGVGVPKSDARAHIWFRKAARLGHSLAQAMISSLYLRRKGVQKDEEHALEWLFHAAKNGHAASQSQVSWGARRRTARRSCSLRRRRPGWPAAIFFIGSIGLT
jgi:TPR repeat protein